MGRYVCRFLVKSCRLITLIKCLKGQKSPGTLLKGCSLKGGRLVGIFRSGGKLLVMAFRKYMTSHGPRTLREGPETPTEWISESVTDGWTLEGRWRRC